jgi:tetratricopeptide (TPR) repeat protein
MPILNTRYILQGWNSPLPGLSQIDLLHLARRLWRSRLPSRNLTSLEVEILKTSRTEEEIPGWMIPQLYFDYLRSRDARTLKRVFYHNAMDIISMAALMGHMADLLENPASHAKPYIQDMIAVARIYEDINHTDKAVNLYELSMHYDLEGDSLYEVLQRLSFIYKRQGEFTHAMRLWEIAAQNQHIYAYIELAKIYEHNLMDYKQAIYYTQTALDTLNAGDLYGYEKELWISELKHREQRLRRKMGLE